MPTCKMGQVVLWFSTSDIRWFPWPNCLIISWSNWMKNPLQLRASSIPMITGSGHIFPYRKVYRASWPHTSYESLIMQLRIFHGCLLWIPQGVPTNIWWSQGNYLHLLSTLLYRTPLRKWYYNHVWMVGTICTIPVYFLGGKIQQKISMNCRWSWSWHWHSLGPGL